MTVDLKCVLLNAENLFLLLDKPLPNPFDALTESEWQKYSTSVYPNKPLHKILKLKSVFEEIDPDLILLTEVGGEESLRNLNQLFLNSNYRVALIEGNSDRSIDVGFLLHKRVQSHFDIVSNKDRPINFWYPHERQLPNQPSHKFSRDAAELHLFNQSMDKPYFIFILTHLKSPLDPDGIDPLGSSRREAEFKALLEIYGHLNKQYPQTPIAICGDLNGDAGRAYTDKEFLNLYQMTDLDDVLELAGRPQHERLTFFPMKSGTLLPGRQIDFALLSSKAKLYLDKNSAAVFRYDIPFRNRPLGPQTVDEKLGLPSDHYPIFFELKNIPII